MNWSPSASGGGGGGEVREGAEAYPDGGLALPCRGASDAAAGDAADDDDDDGASNDDDDAMVDVAPVGDRLVLFFSDRRTPHEVLHSSATRFATTLWYSEGVDGPMDLGYRDRGKGEEHSARDPGDGGVRGVGVVNE